VKTNRSPFAYARALNPKGTYATVGGNIPRLLQTAILSPLISGLSAKHVRVVGLKPNKDLAYINQLFEAGQLTPVIDGQYKLADVADAFRRFGCRSPGQDRHHHILRTHHDDLCAALMSQGRKLSRLVSQLIHHNNDCQQTLSAFQCS
jgi:hypothetical protein